MLSVVHKHLIVCSLNVLDFIFQKIDDKAAPEKHIKCKYLKEKRSEFYLKLKVVRDLY